MKQLLNIFVSLLLTNIAMAQAPQGIPYQAVARNSSGVILASTAISVRFTIRDSVAIGVIKYRETFSVTTTEQGMFSVNVGQGTPVTGTFAGINWGTNAKFMQVELDPAGGSSYIDMGTQQMMSVPYAQYAANSGGGGPWADSAGHIHNTNATARVGIGTTSPRTKLEVVNSSVLFTGPDDVMSITAEAPPISGSGSRLMWYADKAAFRVGQAYLDYWDMENIGVYSFATGVETKASGYFSNAIAFGNIATGSCTLAGGFITEATGEMSVAFGEMTQASGHRSVAIGRNSIASGMTSFSLGFLTNSSGENSISGGLTTTASGSQSIALGHGATASGTNSFSMGYFTAANGEESLAFGMSATAGDEAHAVGYAVSATGFRSNAFGNYVSTNNKAGAFAIGDLEGLNVINDTDNQMAMRFAGGYKLYTSPDLSTGAYMNGGDNSWSTISDRRKKENFAAIDGEAFLKKISKFNLTSWNYKGQDAKVHRHYGPMAQDFYAAFGKDEYGTIGNDTTINQADMEGVSFTAIQALVKRTEELQKKNETLEKEVSALKGQNTTIINENSQLKAELSGRIEAIETELSKTKISTK